MVKNLVRPSGLGRLGLRRGVIAYNGGAAYAEEMLSKALGPEKAGEIMARLISSVRPRHFDFLKDTDPYQLVNLLADGLNDTLTPTR